MSDDAAAECDHCQAYRETLREISLILDLRGTSEEDKLTNIGGELDTCRAPIQ